MTIEMFMLLQQRRLERDVKQTGGPTHPIDHRPPWHKVVKVQDKRLLMPIPPKHVET